MKRFVIGAVLLVVILVITTGCSSVRAAFSSKLENPCNAELPMPGNTLVTGECTECFRQSNGWMKVKINGTWYACTEWRVVLKESSNE